jgi:hypothetical protein
MAAAQGPTPNYWMPGTWQEIDEVARSRPSARNGVSVGRLVHQLARRCPAGQYLRHMRVTNLFFTVNLFSSLLRELRSVSRDRQNV